MAPRLRKNADLAKLLLAWSKHYKAMGHTGAAFVMRKSAKALKQLQKQRTAQTSGEG